MKSNKMHLIAAFLYFTASICFLAAAVMQIEMPPRILCSIAAVCFLIGGAGIFYAYCKNRKANDQ